jgi:class I fructose-bisphosphate aldolase
VTIARAVLIFGPGAQESAYLDGAPAEKRKPVVDGSTEAAVEFRELGHGIGDRTRPAEVSNRFDIEGTIPIKRKRLKVIEMKRKSQSILRAVAAPPSATQRPSLASLSVSHGKRVRLWRMLYGHGPRNGTLAVLPLDQGLEHGPADFFPNPAAVDTDFQFRLAVEGDYSAIALGIGLADKYMKEYAGRIPLILKLNGKTNIADDGDAVSSLSANVEDAVRLGADAVGFTLYVGSPREDAGIRDFQKVRQDCERLGMPVVMWAYPRGRAINARGGKGTLYAQDYAARVAEEMGADLVKLHEPEEDNERCPEPYRSLKEAAPERLRRVVRSAGRVMVLFSGGVKQDNDAAVLRKVSSYMEAGATGVMFGRNMWLRPFDQAVALTRQVHRILGRHPR